MYLPKKHSNSGQILPPTLSLPSSFAAASFSFILFCTSFCLLQVKSEHHCNGSKRQQIMTVTSQNISLLQPEGIIGESFLFALLYVLQTIRVNRSMHYFKIHLEESIQNIIKFYIFLLFFFLALQLGKGEIIVDNNRKHVDKNRKMINITSSDSVYHARSYVYWEGIKCKSFNH